MANIRSCASGCGCASVRSTGCGCGCNTCATARTGCGCNNCASARSTGCGCNTCNGCGCGTARTGCNCFGVLRSISGPFNRCGSCANRNFPFFTGPCGPVNPCCTCCDPCNNCGCNNCNCGCNTCGCNNCNSCNSCGCCDDCDCDCDCDCGCCDCDECHASASFAAATPVELACGDSVTLTPNFSNSRDFKATQDGVEILRSGTYLIVYTVHIPANNAVSSRFVLTLNGERITASALDVATEGDNTTNGFTMHAMVNAQAGSVLKLVSLNPVSICQSSASNVFTLTLTRIP